MTYFNFRFAFFSIVYCLAVLYSIEHALCNKTNRIIHTEVKYRNTNITNVRKPKKPKNLKSRFPVSIEFFV